MAAILENYVENLSPAPKLDVKKMFGMSLRIWRNQLGFSQEELAERSDLQRTYISDLERGARNLSLETMNKLARALEISVSALFPQETQNKEPSLVEENGSVRMHVNILLVEDNAGDVKSTLHAFKQARFGNLIHVLHDGAEALDYLFCNGSYSYRQATEIPQVMLLDLNLPKVSGLEVLRRIKADKRTARMPVVILTALNDNYNLAECQRLGADNFIVKPVNFQRLSLATPNLNLDWVLLKNVVSHAAPAAVAH
jgi:CheY-like chemotaxis protein/DNA-binding XRE family transcriptional regulator